MPKILKKQIKEAPAFKKKLKALAKPGKITTKKILKYETKQKNFKKKLLKDESKTPAVSQAQSFLHTPYKSRIGQELADRKQKDIITLTFLITTLVLLAVIVVAIIK